MSKAGTRDQRFVLDMLSPVGKQTTFERKPLALEFAEFFAENKSSKVLDGDRNQWQLQVVKV